MALEIARTGTGEPEYKRPRSTGAELVPALQEQLIHVQRVDRKSGLFGPTMLLTGHEGEVFCGEFSPDGRSLATGSFDKNIYLWHVYGECENYGVMKGHGNAVLEIHWKHDGQQLYTCSADKSVCVWDPETGKRLKKTEWTYSNCEQHAKQSTWRALPCEWWR